MATVTIGGVSHFSIDGNPYDVAGDFSWTPNLDELTSMSGMTGADQGYSVEPKVGKISTTIRDNSDILVAEFAQMTNVNVVAELRNGKNVLGSNMRRVGELEVDPKESTIKLTFESGSVSEY